MKPIIGPHQRTTEWYALRRNADDPRFGATDAAVLLGESRYKTPRHLYEEFIEPPPPMDNDAMRLGRHLEPAVQSLYAEVHRKWVVREVPVAIHPNVPLFASVDSFTLESAADPRMRGTLDSGVEDWFHGQQFPDADEGADILEIKTSFSHAIADQLGEDGTDWVPTEWLCQVQQQMGVLGLPRAVIAVLLFGKLRTFAVDANPDIIAGIESAAWEMRERVFLRDPPELDWRHETTPELVRALRHDIVGGTWQADGEAVELWALQRDLAAEISTLEKERALVKAKFEDCMIEHEAATALLPNGKQVVRRQASRKGYTVEPKTFWELREMKARDK
jgi:putative phage-type endonuclease